MCPLLFVHIVYRLLVCIVSYSRMLPQLYILITHVYSSVIFANLLVMCHLKFMNAVLCGITRYFAIFMLGYFSSIS